MSPSRTVQKSVTPDSVKALMLIEAIVIAFFSFWLANEFAYNVYFRIYVNSIFVEHFTTYTIALGLGIGLAGTAVAATLYKNLRDAKVKLEAVVPRIRGSMGRTMSNVPSIGEVAMIPPVLKDSLPSNPPAMATPLLPNPPAQAEQK